MNLIVECHSLEQRWRVAIALEALGIAWSGTSHPDSPGPRPSRPGVRGPLVMVRGDTLEYSLVDEFEAFHTFTLETLP